MEASLDIFICYRREDAAAHAGRLADALVTAARHSMSMGHLAHPRHYPICAPEGETTYQGAPNAFTP